MGPDYFLQITYIKETTTISMGTEVYWRTIGL